MTECRVLVTGINGFVGQHMARFLTQRGVQVFGSGRSEQTQLIHPKMSYHVCDLTQRRDVLAWMRHVQPTHLIHLAGQGHVGQSWIEPAAFVDSNAIGTLNLLEAVRQCVVGINRIVVIGSSHEYEFSDDGQAITEMTRTRASSPYGWSKTIQAAICQMYTQSYQLPITVARVFNLIGPGATQGVCSQLIRQVVELEVGVQAPMLPVGNVSVTRDFLDVRDAVQAFWMLLQRNNAIGSELYNVCSGRRIAVREVINDLQKLSRVSFTTEECAEFIRSNDPHTVYGSFDHLHGATGWRPTFSLQQSLVDALHYARLGRGTRKE